MMDFTLAIGDHAPYGFSCGSDQAAVRHAAEYIEARHAGTVRSQPDLPVLLAGPNGILTNTGERLAAFEKRLADLDPRASTDDIVPADATTPDCNQAG